MLKIRTAAQTPSTRSPSLAIRGAILLARSAGLSVTVFLCSLHRSFHPSQLSVLDPPLARNWPRLVHLGTNSGKKHKAENTGCGRDRYELDAVEHMYQWITCLSFGPHGFMSGCTCSGFPAAVFTAAVALSGGVVWSMVMHSSCRVHRKSQQGTTPRCQRPDQGPLPQTSPHIGMATWE